MKCTHDDLYEIGDATWKICDTCHVKYPKYRYQVYKRKATASRDYSATTCSTCRQRNKLKGDKQFEGR